MFVPAQKRRRVLGYGYDDSEYGENMAIAEHLVSRDKQLALGPVDGTPDKTALSGGRAGLVVNGQSCRKKRGSLGV